VRRLAARAAAPFRSAEKQILVGNVTLTADRDHRLDQYLARFPDYSRNLPRVAQVLLDSGREFEILDVGANIGDTAALLRAAGVTNRLHCVEGNASFFRLLEKNAAALGDVSLYQLWLGERDGTASGPVEVGGTASLPGEGSVQITTLTKFASETNL
jgi:hypothetical protein